MPPRLRGGIVPQCSSCLRAALDVGSVNALRPLRQQIRGAKVRTASWHQPASIVVVQLKKSVRGWGREGAYVPVPAGLMRNNWLPLQLARYVPSEELKQLHERGATIERDSQALMGSVTKKKASEKTDLWTENSELSTEQKDSASKVTIEHVEPDHAIQLLEALLPPKLDFERAVRRQDTRKESGEPEKAIIRADVIYGSVTVGDISNAIRHNVSHNDEAARISFPDLHITFLDLPEGEGPMRVRRLGSFNIQINHSGTDRVVKRIVSVVKEPEASKETQRLKPDQSQSIGVLSATKGGVETQHHRGVKASEPAV